MNIQLMTVIERGRLFISRRCGLTIPDSRAGLQTRHNPRLPRKLTRPLHSWRRWKGSTRVGSGGFLAASLFGRSTRQAQKFSVVDCSYVVALFASQLSLFGFEL
jgi:hypothetical protein